MSNPCEGCIYAHSVRSEKEIGRTDTVCRRFPPTPIAIPMQTPQGIHVQVTSVFPPVVADCGEFDDGEDTEGC